MYMETYTGRKFNPAQPKVEDIHLEDIAHALSKICRFGSHLDVHFSVAQHSLICLDVAKDLGLDDELQLYVLSHDFSEAYLGDVPRPLKILLPEYKKIEENVQDAITQFLGLSPLSTGDKEIVKQIDNLALHYEGKYLTSNIGNWIDGLIAEGETYVIERERFDEQLVSIVKDRLIKETVTLINKIKNRIQE